MNRRVPRLPWPPGAKERSRGRPPFCQMMWAARSTQRGLGSYSRAHVEQSAPRTTRRRRGDRGSGSRYSRPTRQGRRSRTPGEYVDHSAARSLVPGEAACQSSGRRPRPHDLTAVPHEFARGPRCLSYSMSRPEAFKVYLIPTRGPGQSSPGFNPGGALGPRIVPSKSNSRSLG